MRLIVCSVVFAVLFAVVLSLRAQQRVTCSCPNPPGGGTTCESGQVAICKIAAGACSGSCSNYAPTLGRGQLAVRFLEDIVGQPSQTLGLSPDGLRRTSETRSAASVRM